MTFTPQGRSPAWKRGQPVPVGDLLGRALRTLGIPSATLTRRVHDAWNRAAEASWKEQAEPMRLEGGVLTVGVTSASLRQELAQFHSARLLEVLKAALPDVSLVGIRFTLEMHRSDAQLPGMEKNDER